MSRPGARGGFRGRDRAGGERWIAISERDLRVFPPARIALGALVAACALACAGRASGVDEDPLLGSGEPVELGVRMGWAGLTAARAVLVIGPVAGGEIAVRGEARTIGAARLLWQMDGTYLSTIEVDGWRSTRSEMVEVYRGKRVETSLRFDRGGVSQVRVVSDRGARSENRKRREGAEICDLVGALLRLRARFPGAGESADVLVYPGNSLYRVTAWGEGRERVRCGWGEIREAMRFRIGIVKVERDGSTRPHRLFRAGTFWMTADAARLPLRVEVEIFVGKIFAEIDRVSGIAVHRKSPCARISDRAFAPAGRISPFPRAI